jgi:hypothetical protein
MTVYQIVNDIHYVNGVELNLEEINEDVIEDRVLVIKEQIEAKKNELDRLVEQRDRLIVHAFKCGFSAIKLGELLNLTRQRIYDVLNLSKQEEE